MADVNQPQQNPLAGLMALMGPNTAAPAAPQQPPPQQAAVPSGGGGPQPPSAPPMGQPPAPQASMSPMIQGLMGQAQQGMSNPMGQPVPPQGAGIAGLAQHPIVQALLKGLAQAAQGYGWTAMQPQERVERTQMEQQKAETLARLAETGTMNENMVGIRQAQLGINEQKANTAEERAKTAEQQANTQQQRADAYDRAVSARADFDKASVQVRKDLGAGRLQEAYAALAERADDFKQKLEQDKGIAEQNIGIKSAHQSTYQGYVDMLGQMRDIAAQQHNTEIAAKAQETLAGLQSGHWFQNIIGMGGPSTAADTAQTIGMPQALPQIGRPAPTTGAPNVAAPTPQNKAAAKSGRQAAKPGDPLGLFP